MKNYVDYHFSKGTKIAVKKFGSNTMWSEFTSQKDNTFTSLQVIDFPSSYAFPHEDYITFRFLNHLAAVKKTDIKVG